MYSKLERIKSVNYKWPSNQVILNYQINATDRSRLTGDQFNINHSCKISFVSYDYIFVSMQLLVIQI